MSELRVLFVGAGAVNFGGAEGPWDHSRRLETLPGVRVVAIADVATEKAREVLANKRTGAYAGVYEECEVYSGFAEAIEQKSPNVAFIGVPPNCHGDLSPPRDIELQCLKAGLHVFIEKPLSVTPPEEFMPYVSAVESVAKEKGLVVSVGYMFRYHAAVVKMKELLEQFGRKVMCINARYNCAYAASTHPFWWYKSRSGGPIVEQATHFCDLLRYLGGEVNFDTLSAIAIPASDDPKSPGFLASVNPCIKESTIPLGDRVPRLTSANWKFADGGGVGSLTHGVALHGKKYETAIDVWGDGIRLLLEEPYFPECRLRVRIGNTDEEKVYTFPTADPYLEEDLAFIEAVRTGNHAHIRSGYCDAAKTYELSWAIRRASEK